LTLDHKQRRLRHKIHLFVSFLGLLLRETDQKRVIYVNLKKMVKLVIFVRLFMQRVGTNHIPTAWQWREGCKYDAGLTQMQR